MKNHPLYFQSIAFLSVILISCFLMVPAVHSEISVSGDVTPDDPASWSGSTKLSIGSTGTGTLDITEGSSVKSRSADVGVSSGSLGIVNVDGTGSVWDALFNPILGVRGTGKLNVTNGGSVTSTYLDVGKYSGSAGFVSVQGTGSTLTVERCMSVGFEGDGTFSITNEGALVTSGATLGYYAGSSGTVTVDGVGSSWINSGELNIGNDEITMIGNKYTGSGTLNILNGATVSGTSYTTVGNYGNIAFGDNGGTLTTENLYISGASQVSGTGTINTSGLIMDIDLVFDNDHGLKQTVNAGNVSINLNLDGSGNLGVGYLGEGTLTITDGVLVESTKGYLGFGEGAMGTAIVDGSGSTWANSGNLIVGSEGSGELFITNGGLVTNASAYLSGWSGARGSVTVDGQGSTWASSDLLYMGVADTASVTITNGGTVTAGSLSIYNDSILTIDAGTGSSLKVGTSDDNWAGTIKNNGTIRLVADSSADSGTYTLMYYDTMQGEGSVQGLGGLWDASDHTFTISEAVTSQGAGGASVSLDLTQNQRAEITDTETGKSAGAAFIGGDAEVQGVEALLSAQDANALASITLSITALAGDELTALENLVSQTQGQIFSAWNFIVEGYTPSEDTPVYLWLDAGSATDILDLTILYLSDGLWVEYDATDLAFDGTYAGFTATGLGAFALVRTSSVPVPGSLFLLAAGLACVTGLARNRKTSLT